jgi:hypothetical protein
MAGGGPAQIKEVERRLRRWSGVRIGLTGRILILVIFAVVPALVIQAWNEYDLRIAREADIRQQVVQTTKQFGEEIGELREGARQLPSCPRPVEHGQDPAAGRLQPAFF